MSLDGTSGPDRANYEKHWNPISVPTALDVATHGTAKDYAGVAWDRCAVRVPQAWLANDGLQLILAAPGADAWLNGHQLNAERAAPATLRIPPAAISVDDAGR